MIVRAILIALLLMTSAVFAAHAQSARVVQSCGTLPATYPVGSSQPPTVDINGNTCGTQGAATTTDPCGGLKTYTSDASQTASARYVTGTIAKKTYICQVFIFASAAETVSVVEGTGSTCGTNTKALYGNATVANGLAVPANGGFSIGSGLSSVQVSPSTGTDICVLQSGTSRVNVSLVTVQQ